MLLEAFMIGVHHYYGDPDDELVPWDSGEGGYLVATYDAEDVVGHLGDVLVGDGVLEAVVDAMDDRAWVERDWMESKRDRALKFAWSQFREAIMHRTRYVFWLGGDAGDETRGPGDVPASQVLHHLARMILDYDLVVPLAKGETLWRGQPHSEPALDGGYTPSRLGTAPYSKSMQPNRMSPPGIPMFYGAFDEQTAIAEVVAHAPGDQRCVTTAGFVTSRETHVVDLTRVPEVPSKFDPQRGGFVRREVKFLRAFVDDIQQPPNPETAAVDYVPTQVVTEFILRALEKVVPELPKVEGIIYPSVARPGGKALVLDVDNEHCLGDPSMSPDKPTLFGPAPDKLLLILDPASVRTDCG